MRTVRAIMITVSAAALGAGAALLLAPQSGERTRRQLRRKTEDLIHDIRKNAEQRAHDAYDLGRSKAQRIRRQMRASLKAA
jgi:gas vesicle protein